MAGRRRRTQWLNLAAAGLIAPVCAASPPAPVVPAATAAAVAEPAPAPAAGSATQAALLLFLSEFEDADGEWLDPADLPAPVLEDEDDAH